MRTHAYRLLIGLTLLGQASMPALAALGGTADTVQADSTHMKARMKAATPGPGFSVQELQLPSGTVVREYISPSGTVFAVSWHGPTMPDLRQTLGTYFQQYTAASSVAPRGGATHRHFRIQQSDLVVESNGRMRAYYGRAYVPSLLPPNVTASDIQ